MAAPLDGYGMYESRQVSDATNPARLAAMAALGLKLVLNYGMLFGHLTDLTSYINTAASNGMKVIVAIHDPVIWDGSTNMSTKYGTLIGDWGGSGTDYAGFTTWLVNQLKGLSGVWGWYVGDEIPDNKHSLLLTHAQVIRAADSTHPRLYMGDGTLTTTSVGSGASIFGDVSEVIGDDFYPVGVSRNAVGEPAFVTEYTGIQAYANAHNLQSAVTLQAWSYAQTSTNNSLLFYPGEAPYPYREVMLQQKQWVEANMTPRLVLWYYFPYIYDSAFTVDGARQRADLAWVIANIGAADQVIARDNFLRIQASGWNPASSGEIWSNPNNFTLSCYSFHGAIATPGAGQPGYLLLGAGTCYNPNFLYRWVAPHLGDEVGPVLRYTSGSNLVRVEISNNVMVIARYVSGTRTYVSSTVTTVPIVSGTAYWGRVTSNAGVYTVKVWADGQPEPGSPQLTWTDTNYVATSGQYGIFAYVNSTANSVYVNSFEVYVTAVNQSYYVAVGGSDSNPGTSSQPFATVQQALNAVNPGDTIYVKLGVFIPSNVTYPTSGSSVQPITIWSYTPFLTLAANTQHYVYNSYPNALFPATSRRTGVFSTTKRRQS